MSSFIASNNLRLMMLEIAVENLYVPWTSEFDKVILKKTFIMFRMLDEDWTSLSPDWHDCRSYRGFNHENEKFHGGRSVVFCVPATVLEEKADGFDIQIHVWKEACKYFETDLGQNVGFAAVPVDDLLNGIRKQLHERNELAEHLSDLYKRQIISRSTMGTYSLLGENFESTAATISLYIRISYLGRSVITETTCIESTSGSFYVRGETNEGLPYYLQQLTPENLQSGYWDSGGSLLPRNRLICSCKDLVKKEAANLTSNQSIT